MIHDFSFFASYNCVVGWYSCYSQLCCLKVNNYYRIYSVHAWSVARSISIICQASSYTACRLGNFQSNTSIW